MIDKSAIDPNALQLYRMLKEAGFSAYFVGGSVRDLLLGKSPKDFDIATNATPQQIKRIIPQGRIIGRRFRHVMLEKQGGRYEIVTFRGPVVQAEGEQAELDDEALEDHPVSENGEESPGAPANGNGAERVARRSYPDLNQFGNAEQDAKRRDFTINALFYDPDADELVDYVEGKLDIDRRLIRSIGDSMQRMEEDPIRILRAIRHKMKLGLSYDASLEAAMRDKAPLLEQTSKDRIREEFLKVCNDHSLGAFLAESRRLGLVPHIMPWFEGISEEGWETSMRHWTQLKNAPVPERPYPDLGLSLMMAPLIGPLVLEPYKAALKESEKSYLPDMKYFLSCEALRNYYLRNLRVSRAQTDHIVRALFYFSRMSGLWLEQGPPRRILGRLFQHPPALLAARMAQISLEAEGRDIPPWILELAEHDSSQRRGRSSREAREHTRGRGRDDRREPRSHKEDERDLEEGEEAAGDNHEQPRRREERESPKVGRLPPPDQPMVWNGPLHAPVLRPNFPEEPTIRWARRNQTVRAYRPSGVPNQPTDHALLKSSLVYNYKPELEGGEQRSQGEGGGTDARADSGRNGRGRRGGRGRGRGRDRDLERVDQRQETSQEAEAASTEEAPSGQSSMERTPPRPRPSSAAPFDEDMIGNIRRPGEAPAPLEALDNVQYPDDENVDDNIGNRLDAPPTSGHVGINGEGVLGRQGAGRAGQGFRTGSGREGGGGGRQGRGRRRGRRGGGGGGGDGGQSRRSSRNSHFNP